MTWNWSHTQEAYDNVYYNISQLPLGTLKEIAAEIKTYQTMLADRPGQVIPNRNDMWNEDLYFSFLEGEDGYFSKEDLVDFIYKFASEQAECTDGGHEAYICPYGNYKVSFSKTNQ